MQTGKVTCYLLTEIKTRLLKINEIKIYECWFHSNINYE